MNTMAGSDKQSKSGRNNDDDDRTRAATGKQLDAVGAPKCSRNGRTTDAETTYQTVSATHRGTVTTNSHEWPVDDRDKETETATRTP